MAAAATEPNTNRRTTAMIGMAISSARWTAAREDASSWSPIAARPETCARIGRRVRRSIVWRICGSIELREFAGVESTETTISPAVGLGRSWREPGCLSQGEMTRVSGRAARALLRARPWRLSGAAGPSRRTGTVTLRPKRWSKSWNSRADSEPATPRVLAER